MREASRDRMVDGMSRSLCAGLLVLARTRAHRTPWTGVCDGPGARRTTAGQCSQEWSRTIGSRPQTLPSPHAAPAPTAASTISAAA
ncbi:hypothetical protein MBT84_44785 [Streptomyces sp. MBT84]|nr:hypothetical protein [Streptomyces sp. MBT84]